MPELQLDLPILLPHVPDARDTCVRRLTASLEAQDGVKRAHVLDATNGKPAQICIHYDPDVLPLPRLRQLALRHGARLTDHYGHVLWEVTGIRHQRRARTVAAHLRRLRGVLEAEASAAGQLRVEFERTQIRTDDLRRALSEVGVMVVEPKAHEAIAGDTEQQVASAAREEAVVLRREHDAKTEHDESEGDHKHGGIFGEQTELIFAILSGTCVGLGWGLETFTSVVEWGPFALYLGGFFFGGFFTLREAIGNFRIGRFEIDFLMLIAAAGAAVLGEWFEGALLLFLFSMGHALEHYAMGRARKAIEALADLAPDTAVVRRDQKEREIPVEELMVGDTVVVRTNERIPADGFVVKGTSAVNQAPVTGESVPVDKQPVGDLSEALESWQQLASEHRVFAGTINGSV